ncbi:hypothetical protein GCM10009816_22510 [Microbacterium aquimaris]
MCNLSDPPQLRARGQTAHRGRGNVGQVSEVTDPTPSSLFTPALRAGASVIRRIDGDDTPWPGVVARLGDGVPVLVVAVRALGEDWPGWTLPGGGHVLVPVDVRRSDDGHDAVFPLCVERVAAFLARRREALEDGERVTLAVSILRGTRSVAEAGVDASMPGTWWLTDDGRPVLAVRSARGIELDRAASDLLRDPAFGDGELGRVCAAAAQAVEDGLLDTRTARRLEDDLFRAAEPAPLAMVGFGPRPSAAAGPRLQQGDASGRDLRGTGAIAQLGRFADRWWAQAVPAAITRVRSRARASRRSTVLFAGAAASGALALGLLWPAAAEESPRPVAATSGAATPSPGVSVPAEDGQVDLAAVTGALLDAIGRCGQDAACRDGVTWTGESTFPPGVVDLPAGLREIQVLDDFGGVAVVRVSDSRGEDADQLVVIARRDDSWLLRDVHDVTQQP